MTKAVLSLGSNIGDRYHYIREMEKALLAFASVLEFSPLYETAPVGVSEDHEHYLNRIVLIETALTVKALLATLQSVEVALGRTSKGGLEPRTADLDILLYEGVTVESDVLTVPHHALFKRRFSFEGALYVVPDWILATGSPLRECQIDPAVLKQEMRIVACLV